jgi:hypothetical protein
VPGFGEEFPKDRPWDPIPKTDGATVTRPSATGFARLLRWLRRDERSENKCAPAADTLKARTLQDSAPAKVETA